jgi:hypothetical protein
MSECDDALKKRTGRKKRPIKIAGIGSKKMAGHGEAIMGQHY